MRRLDANPDERLRTPAAARRPVGHSVPEAAVQRYRSAIGNRRFGRLARQAAGAPAPQSKPGLTAKRGASDDEVLVWQNGIAYRVRRQRHGTAGPQPAKQRRGLVLPNPQLEPSPANPQYQEDAKRRFLELRLGMSNVKIRPGFFKEFESASPATGSAPLVEPNTVDFGPLFDALGKDVPLRNHRGPWGPARVDPAAAQAEAKLIAEGKHVEAAMRRREAAKREEEMLKGQPFTSPNLKLPVPDSFHPKESVREQFGQVVWDNGRMRVSAFGSTTLEGGDVSNKIGKVSVGSGRYDVGFEGGEDGAGKRRAVAFFAIDLGSREEASAPAAGAGEWDYVVEVQRLVQRPGPVELAFHGPRSGTVPEDAEKKIYLYFAGGGSKIDLGRSAREIAQLEQAIESGFRVTRVEAFTSPEGSLERNGRYRGNRVLAQERARAATEYVRGRWSHALPAGGDATTSRTVEGSELYGSASPDGPELAGRELVDHAVKRFGESAAEERHRTDDRLEKLKRARSSRQRAALIYPLLRRAEITLTGTVDRFRPLMPGGAELVRRPGPWESEWVRARSAPKDILDKAASVFVVMDDLRRQAGK
jgi:hypothetical protein